MVVAMETEVSTIHISGATEAQDLRQTTQTTLLLEVVRSQPPVVTDKEVVAAIEKLRTELKNLTAN